MASASTITSVIIKSDMIQEKYSNKVVDKFRKLGLTPILEDKMEIKFEIDKNLEKMNCYLEMAKPEHALEITNIYKDAYSGTYPYKEMEDPEAIRKMISDKGFYFVLFKTPEGKIIGCTTYVLDLKNRKGYMRGLMIKKKYQMHTNVKKIFIGSMIGMWSSFADKVFLWYAECRTANKKAQYFIKVCGMEPLAFFPNKDVFENEIESDVFQIIYSENILYELRKKTPKLIRQVEDVYSHIREKYDLEKAKYETPVIQYDPDVEESIYSKSKIEKTGSVDRFGYHSVKIGIRGTDSYIKFLYTPNVQNIEKTKYHVSNETELYVLLKELKKYAKLNDIRYIECFVSAFKPKHQQIFIECGFKIRGYIPSWKRKEKDQKEIFVDHIVFNMERGKIRKDMKLIPEAEILVDLVYR